MSLATRSPLRMIGGNVNSGNVNTGELMTVRGGVQRGCVWSGSIAAGTNGVIGQGIYQASGGHAIFQSGPGRLNTVTPTVQFSGSASVFFYDAGTITQSGISVSGFPIVGVIPANPPPSYTSGYQSVIVFGGQPLNVDIPFSSGLCAAIPSGCPGFTVTWSVETNPLVA